MLSDQMRRELAEQGFTVLERFIQGAELERIASAVQRLAKYGDGGRVCPVALEMMVYEPMLPYLVDAMGWNIHMRDGLITCRPPDEGPIDFGKLATGWHIDQQVTTVSAAEQRSTAAAWAAHRCPTCRIVGNNVVCSAGRIPRGHA